MRAGARRPGENVSLAADHFDGAAEHIAAFAIGTRAAAARPRSHCGRSPEERRTAIILTAPEKVPPCPGSRSLKGLLPNRFAAADAAVWPCCLALCGGFWAGCSTALRDCRRLCRSFG
jgi:hypothetical protein